jgi:deoxycytidylate deaminase
MDLGSGSLSPRDLDYELASKAIEEARKSPMNTRVGAVIARGGSILASG